MKFIISIILTLSTVSLLPAQCIKGNCDNGKGKFKYSDNSTYQGQFKNGFRNGKGRLQSHEGIYVGDFIRNLKDGEGKITYPSGDTYIGQFKKGYFHGKGKFTSHNGDIYKGEWSDGKREGQGNLLKSSKENYIGLFVNDQFHGKGTLIKSNQDVVNGIWQNGILISTSQNTSKASFTANSNTSLIDCNSKNCDNIIGRYKYSDGSIYEGMMIKNLPQGEGICKYSNGSEYRGGWKNHGPHGVGVMTYISGRKYAAEWNYGIPIRQITDNEIIYATSKKSKTQFDETVEIYACIIGIASYSHMPSLKYTDDDAYHMYAFLKSPEGGALRNENISILIDDAATKNNILYEMNNIAQKADENDVVIFYLSGHGIKGSYIPNDFDGFNDNLPYSDILGIIDNSSAKHKLCVVDACHSGSIALPKSSISQGLESYYSKFKSVSGGTALLTLSKSEELSLEYSGLRHGVFSHFLIEGLRGNADLDEDGIVTIEELYNNLYTKVVDYTNSSQKPTLSGKYNPQMPISNNTFNRNL